MIAAKSLLLGGPARFGDPPTFSAELVPSTTPESASFCIKSLITDQCLLEVASDAIHLRTPLTHVAGSLKVEGTIVVNDVPQWQMVYREDLSNGSLGWDNARTDLVTDCAGIRMLGGPDGGFSQGEIVKEISGLPPHRRLMVHANVHFIDDWSGESAFVRVNIGDEGIMVPVWTDSHDERGSEANGLSLCGSATPDSKFSVPVRTSFEHLPGAIRLGFGSTISENAPKLKSWGVSGIELYIQ